MNLFKRALNWLIGSQPIPAAPQASVVNEKKDDTAVAVVEPTVAVSQTDEPKKKTTRTKKEKSPSVPKERKPRAKKVKPVQIDTPA